MIGNNVSQRNSNDVLTEDDDMLFSKSFHAGIDMNSNQNAGRNSGPFNNKHSSTERPGPSLGGNGLRKDSTPSFMKPTKSSVVKGSIAPNIGEQSNGEVLKNFNNNIRGGAGNDKSSHDVVQNRPSNGLMFHYTQKSSTLKDAFSSVSNMSIDV